MEQGKDGLRRKMNYKEEFVKFMVEAGVLTFGDFITKSGRKTPYFINTGNYKTGAQMRKLGAFYARCIMENTGGNFTALFGPAYKGIPLSVAASIGLSELFDMDKYYCFNRKEAKDHGEGGNIVGYKLRDGDSVVITEDVVTAGTAVRECVPILKAAADVNIKALIVSVDRMEKGAGEKTAIQEIYETFGIRTYPIVTVREVIEMLHNQEVGGRVYIGDEMRGKMEDYLKMYC